MNQHTFRLFAAIVVFCVAAMSTNGAGLTLLGNGPAGATDTAYIDACDRYVNNWLWRLSHARDANPYERYPGYRPDRTRWFVENLERLEGLTIDNLGELAQLTTNDFEGRYAIVTTGLKTLGDPPLSFEEVVHLCRSVRGRAGCALAIEYIPSVVTTYERLAELVTAASGYNGTSYVTAGPNEDTVVLAGIRHLEGVRGLPLTCETLATLVNRIPRAMGLRHTVALQCIDRVSDLSPRGLDHLVRVVDASGHGYEVRKAGQALLEAPTD